MPLWLRGLLVVLAFANLLQPVNAESESVLSTVDVECDYVDSGLTGQRVLVSGGVVNLGGVQLRHVMLRARLMDSSGTVLESVESARLDRSYFSRVKLNSATQRQKAENSLMNVLPAGRRMTFEFVFNRVLERAVSLDIVFLYSTTYLRTLRKKQTIYTLALPGLDAEGLVQDKSVEEGKKAIWHYLRMGMTVAEVEKGLARAKRAALLDGGMIKGTGTMFITTYEAGNGRLKLNFHGGRLFSYRSKLPPSPDNLRRKAILSELAKDFSGVTISLPGGGYFSEEERNAIEYSGSVAAGVKVETQGDWLFLYEEDSLKEVQRLEYQGR